MMLASLAQAKLRTRFDNDSLDSDIQIMLEAASQYIVTYLGMYASTFLDTAGEPDVDTAGDPIGVPPVVVNAVLLLTRILLKSDDPGIATMFAQGQLPWQVTGMLYIYKDQVFA